MHKKIGAKAIIVFGILIILFGIFILAKDYFKSKKLQVYETMYFALTDQPTYNESTTEEEEPLDNDVEVNDDGEEVFINRDYYVGRIEIPKIRLVKGFCAKDSSWNDVRKNVSVLSAAQYPDVDKGNFILAAHAGTAWNSFFEKLYKLSIGDQSYVYYNGMKYTYTVVNIYDVPKTGYVKIYRNKDKTTMTLITCTQRDMKNQQTVYILELTSIEYE